jgi:hypothetical protein
LPLVASFVFYVSTCGCWTAVIFDVGREPFFPLSKIHICSHVQHLTIALGLIW